MHSEVNKMKSEVKKVTNDVKHDKNSWENVVTHDECRILCARPCLLYVLISTLPRYP